VPLPQTPTDKQTMKTKEQILDARTKLNTLLNNPALTDAQVVGYSCLLSGLIWVLDLPGTERVQAAIDGNPTGTGSLEAALNNFRRKQISAD
jgi:hypothetical protein